MERLHLLAVQAGEIQIPLVGQKAFKLIDGQGLEIVVALGVPAA